jgi:tripartite ATP-independent transporter DctP family solute receptor
MKKKLALMLILAMAIAIVATGCGGSQSEGEGNGDAEGDVGEVYELKVSHIASESDPIHQGWLLLKNTLEEKSGGRITVTIFGNKQLSNSNNEDAEKVQQNIVQATSVPTSSLAALGNIKEYQVFDYPYLFETEDELYKVLDSDRFKELSQQLADVTGVKAYGGYNLGWVQISTNKNPINTPADLKGHKIRTMSSELQMKIAEAFGANPTIVNYGEVFTACQQGTVDGIMTSTGLYVSDRFYEVQKYMGCVRPIALLHVPIINVSWYEALPDDLKAIFDESMEIYLDGVRQYELEFEAAAIEELKAKGMEVKEYTDEEMQAFKDASANIIVDKADIAGQEIIDTVLTILNK